MKRKRCCDRCEEPTCALKQEATIEVMPVSIPGVFIANSKSQEGKSHLLKYIAHAHRDEFDYAMGISGTGGDEQNLPFIPKDMTYFSWPGEKTKKEPQGETKAAIERMIAEQLKIPKEERPIVLLAIEDEFESLKDPLILALATRPTHYNVWLFIACNWINKVPPGIREGAWQVAIFKTETKAGLQAAYESYGLDCWDLAAFRKLVNEGTGEFRFLYKNLKGKGGDKGWHSMRAPFHIPDFTISPPTAYEEEEEDEYEREEKTSVGWLFRKR